MVHRMQVTLARSRGSGIGAPLGSPSARPLPFGSGPRRPRGACASRPSASRCFWFVLCLAALGPRGGPAVGWRPLSLDTAGLPPNSPEGDGAEAVLRLSPLNASVQNTVVYNREVEENTEIYNIRLSISPIMLNRHRSYLT